MNGLVGSRQAAMMKQRPTLHTVKKGDQYYALGEYYDAAAEYKAAYSKTPTKQRDKRGERAVKMADCYQRINYTAKAIGAYQNGIRYMEKAMADRKKAADLALATSKKTTKKSSKKNADSQPSRANSKRNRKGNALPEPTTEAMTSASTEDVSPEDSLAQAIILSSTLRLARLQQKNGDYKGAIQNYERYMEDCKTFYAFYPSICTPQNDTLAMNGLVGSRQAAMMKQRPTLHTVKKEPLLNSRRADFSPALFGDDWDQIYWSSTRPQATGDDLSGITGTKYADIFVSRKDDKGKWGSPEKVEGDFNTALDEGACCFSPDGKTMFLTYCAADPEYPRYAQIYTSSRSDASWSKPQLLKISKDTLSCFAHPAVSPDGEWLYFVSDMPGGHGGKDIWRIGISGTNIIGGVENLGAPVNTPGDEMFPTFRFNGDLYYSSDGHPGMGGLDIFIAKQDTTTQEWSVKNLGYPMNSPGDDFGMTFEGVHNRGFFSTNRGDARGWDHLMSFECPEVLQTIKGWVYEKDGYELPAGLVYMIGNDGTNQKLSVRGDGSFTAVVQPRVDYVFLGTCKGYLNHVEQLSVDTSSVSHE